MTRKVHFTWGAGKLSKVSIAFGVLLAACVIWLVPPYLVESDASKIATSPARSEVASSAPPSSTAPSAAATGAPTTATQTGETVVEQLTPASASALGSARQSVLLTIGGLIAVITLALSYARHKREEVASDLAADSNKTDRYTQAIDQLGSSEVPIQLGGVYALERLARDSENDRQTIVDVLAAFLRTTSPADLRSAENTTVGTVAAAAATVIGRMQILGVTLRIDLTGVNLTRARLEKASFADAILNGAVFDHAHLENANLDNAQLNNASFAGTFLIRATLRGAQGIHTTLKGARAHHADFSDAILRHAKITSSGLEDAIFDRVDLFDSRLHGSKFARASLEATDFTKANINLADFTGADVSRALLSKTNTAGSIGLVSVESP